MSDASNGSAAKAADDPFFVQLPPGWTYTLASQQAAAIPEPTSLALTLITLGVVGIGVIRHRTRAR
ncbi:MAG TPA: PEP-CTERM sorting domain-containing protein [Candidatus Eremiobacteraceae bacterium]|nr:PEP-CTERM sorting domain-containing protein [Candidatus Eremiobacteraceae bacterium]